MVADWKIKKGALPLVAVAALLAAALIFSKHGGDFWLHAAMIRELADHPFHPQHPIFGGTPENVFFTPYHLLLGFLVRISGFSAPAWLSAAAWVNAAVWFTGMVKWGRGQGLSHTSVALLIGLVLVGCLQPWYYSGFFSVAEWPSVMAYPSAMAFGLGLHVISDYQRVIATPAWTGVVGIPLLSGVIVLIHPLTAVAVALGGLAIFIFSKEHLPKALVVGGIAVIASLGLLFFWPYFTWQDLLLPASDIHAANRELYARLWLHFLPAALGLIPLGMRVRRTGMDAQSVWFIALLVVFAGGALLDKWAFGRVAMWMVLLLLAEIALWWQSQTWKWGSGRVWILAAMILFSCRYYRAWMGWFLPQNQALEAEVRLVAGSIPPHAQVLAGEDFSEILPAFGVYVCSYSPEQASLSGFTGAQDFFSTLIDDSTRATLLREINPDFVLFRESDPGSALNFLQWNGWKCSPIHGSSCVVCAHSPGI